MTISEAARKWKIPRTTLNDLKLGHYKPDARPGPPTLLTSQEENLLKEWVLDMSRRGLHLTELTKSLRSTSKFPVSWFHMTQHW
jgi:hypothetical protein